MSFDTKQTSWTSRLTVKPRRDRDLSHILHDQLAHAEQGVAKPRLHQQLQPKETFLVQSRWSIGKKRELKLPMQSPRGRKRATGHWDGHKGKRLHLARTCAPILGQFLHRDYGGFTGHGSEH